MQRRHVAIIVITGGPCAGKSTVLSGAKQWLENHGCRVAIASEEATELILAGFSPNPAEWKDELSFQGFLLSRILNKMLSYSDMLHSLETDKPLVLLCDRGPLDAIAYVQRSAFHKVAEGCGTSIANELERIKAVIHMVTAANGAEAAYTLANNAARTETPGEARALDVRTMEAWRGHRHHIIIDNSTDFEGKKLRTLQSLARVLHMPEPTEIERKFRIINFSQSMVPDNAVAVEIVQNYLTSSDPELERRVRMRTIDGVSSYFYTEKRKSDDSTTRYEKEDGPLLRSKYEEYLLEKDEMKETIRKTRYVFQFNNQTLEVDVYQNPGADRLVILEIELQHKDQEISLPPGWECTEVTDDKNFSNARIATLLRETSAGQRLPLFA